MIKVEGRDLSSRFVPAVHPVFPRTYWDSTASPARTVEEPVTPVKRGYPAGPTASNWVYRSEPYDKEHKNKNKDKKGNGYGWAKKHSGK